MKTNAIGQKRTFSFMAPGAGDVLLAGDFTRWLTKPIRLHMDPDGVWRATVSLAPGTWQYRYFVDGEWRDDPECKVRVRNPFGTVNDVIKIRADTRAQAEPKATACSPGSAVPYRLGKPTEPRHLLKY